MLHPIKNNLTVGVDTCSEKCRGVSEWDTVEALLDRSHAAQRAFQNIASKVPHLVSVIDLNVPLEASNSDPGTDDDSDSDDSTGDSDSD